MISNYLFFFLRSFVWGAIQYFLGTGCHAQLEGYSEVPILMIPPKFLQAFSVARHFTQVSDN
jgi:hypothetical protein